MDYTEGSAGFMFIKDVIMIYFFHLVPLLPIHLLNMHESSDLFLKCHIYFVVKSCFYIKFTFKKKSNFLCGESWKQDKALGRLALENHMISMFC